MSALVQIVQTVVAPETDKTSLKNSAGSVSILFNHMRLTSFEWDIDKRCRPSSDVGQGSV